METQLEIEQADVQAPSDQMRDQTTTPKVRKLNLSKPVKRLCFVLKPHILTIPLL